MHHYVVGISGASGMPYAWKVVATLLQQAERTVHLTVTEPGWRVLQLEHQWSVTDRAALWQRRYESLPGTLRYHAVQDVGACVASGSFLSAGMIVVPCSMGTLARIAHGFSANLLERVADVMLKEKRPLVIVPRETPLHAVHLENMLRLAQWGVRVVPAMPAFYQQPQDMNDLIDFVAGKALDALQIPHQLYRRWTGRQGGKEYDG